MQLIKSLFIHIVDILGLDIVLNNVVEEFIKEQAEQVQSFHCPFSVYEYMLSSLLSFLDVSSKIVLRIIYPKAVPPELVQDHLFALSLLGKSCHRIIYQTLQSAVILPDFVHFI